MIKPKQIPWAHGKMLQWTSWKPPDVYSGKGPNYYVPYSWEGNDAFVMTITASITWDDDIRDSHEP